jgi:adenine-specific DNA-methyltransferase
LRKCLEPTFTYIDFDSYVSAAFYVIKTSRFDLKYLTGLLNSKLIAFWLKHKGKIQGNNFQIDKEPLLSIPIPFINQNNEIIKDQIASLVDKIILSKQQKPQADTSDLENQIDIMVYKLYDLTYDEVKIIDSEIEKIISQEEYDKIEVGGEKS